MFELYLMDLTPEKRLEFLEAHGAWEVDVNDPSTFPNNWDIYPIMVFDTDDINIFEQKKSKGTTVSERNIRDRNRRIMVSDLDSYDALYEAVRDSLIDDYGSIDNALEQLGYTFDDEMILETMDAQFDDYMDVIDNAQGLEIYWRRYGWTLDRGYGGPNYKERVADGTDWENLFDYIIDTREVSDIFDAVLITPTELNDLVIFNDDEDDTE